MKNDEQTEYDVLPESPLLRTMTLNEQIDWFEKSTQRWIFEPAKLLLKHGDTDVDYAVLAILNAVPEMLAKCKYEKEGEKHRSSDLYRKGIEYIFPEHYDNVFSNKEFIDELMYKRWRNGLAHFGFVSERIQPSRNGSQFDSIVIDPVSIPCMPGWTYFPPTSLSVHVPDLLCQMEKRIGNYISDLRNPNNEDLRNTFSERISRIEPSLKGESTGCVCGAKRFCHRCADSKLPEPHLKEAST